MSDIDFGAPVPVTDLPPSTTSGRGRIGYAPALNKWLDSLTPGTWELASPDGAGMGHPQSRVTLMHKLAKEREGIKVETRPVDNADSKRRRIYATVGNGVSPTQ